MRNGDIDLITIICICEIKTSFQVTYKGQMYKAVITGLVRDRRDCPRFDTNNCVFINDKHEPLGTRISGPVSLKLRRYGKYNKLLSLCTDFY